MIEQVALSARLRKESPMSNYGSGRDGSASEGDSTLLPMLIAGLVTVVIGITVAAFFV
jgi:hypothetical protein